MNNGGSMGRHCRPLAMVVAGALVLAGAMAMPAMAADTGGGSWTSARLPGLAGKLFLLNVSCPSESLCVATGTQNAIAASTDPTGGGAAWKVVYAGEGADEIGPTGSFVGPNRQVEGVSCPSAHLCVAVTALGQIYATSDPTGPASSWKVTEVPSEGGNTHLYGVSCPDASLCVAVSGRGMGISDKGTNRDEVFTSTNPTGGPAAWELTELDESLDLRAVSCSSPSLCILAGANGELVASSDPTGGPSAWSRLGAPGGPQAQQAISCVSSLCLTGNSGGDLLTSTNPLEAASWRQRSGGGSVQITGSSCPSATACVAVDANGHVLTSTDPTGGSSAWASTIVAPYSPEVEESDPKSPNGLFGASCPSESLCTLVGSGGQIFTSTDPFAPPSASPKGSGGVKKQPHGRKRPKTTIARLVLPTPREMRRHRAHVMARFYADGPVRRFECEIDRRQFRPCHSPWFFRVGRGVYGIRIRAVGATGLRGPALVRRFWLGEKRCIRRNTCLESGELPVTRR